jgi:hypothetical protein
LITDRSTPLVDPLPAEDVTMPKTILFLAANPATTDHLRLDEEVREIDDGLRRAKQGDSFVLEQRWALRPEDLRRAMLDYAPQIVHFSGHGAGSDGIVLEDDNKQPKLVSTEAIEGFFALFPEVECVVLNACYSEVQAQAIAQSVPYVVGMHNQIGDEAARIFAVSFYDAIGAGKSVEFAHKLACNAIQMEGSPGFDVPILVDTHSARVESSAPQSPVAENTRTRPVDVTGGQTMRNFSVSPPTTQPALATTVTGTDVSAVTPVATSTGATTDTPVPQATPRSNWTDSRYRRIGLAAGFALIVLFIGMAIGTVNETLDTILGMLFFILVLYAFYELLMIGVDYLRSRRT